MKIYTGSLRPPHKFLKRMYLSILLFVVGRALQTAYRIDETIRKEIDSLGEDFAVALKIKEQGPSFFVKKEITKKGKIQFKYKGKLKKESKTPSIIVNLKNIEAAFLLFTFRESTCQAEANSRIIVDGSLEDTLCFVRVLSRLEIFLLPRFIAKKAVKRYESPEKKWKKRFQIYSGLILGY